MKVNGGNPGNQKISLARIGLPAVPQLKEKAREAVSSAWLVLAFVPLLNWAAFFWMGSRAKQAKWTVSGCLYFMLSIPLFIMAIVLAFKLAWLLFGMLYALHIIAWGVSILHAFGSRKEYLVRCEALAGKREEENRAYREQIQSDYAPPPPVVVASAQDIFRSEGLNPDGIRKYLGQLRLRHPALAALLDGCVKQLDAIQNRRANLDALIALNNASYLTDATGALREAEQLILQNHMWVVNRGIVAEADDVTGDEFILLIQRVLAANDEVLAKCRTLVAGASDLISGKGSTGSTAMIEAWTVAIRQQVRTSALNIKEE